MVGSNGSIYAIGDAATINQPKAIDYAEELFKEVSMLKSMMMVPTQGLHRHTACLLACFRTSTGTLAMCTET